MLHLPRSRALVIASTLSTVLALSPLSAPAAVANVLPLATAPRAQASPPSRLPRVTRAALPFVRIVPQRNIVAPLAAPRVLATPPALRTVPRGGPALGTHTVRPLLRSRAAQALPATTSAVLAESFSGAASTANAWTFGDNACLTAGSAATTPSTSIPACGANAPLDAVGSGTLELTPPVNNTDGFVFNRTALASSNGIAVTFDYYSYATAGTPGDGVALVFNDASPPLPTAIGGCCGSLGYATHAGSAQLAGGYLAVGFDESGYFSAANESKTGGLGALLADTIGVRGATAINAPYLFGYTSGGQAAALPFSLDAPASSARPTPLTMTVTLTPDGKLAVAVDRHDGNGSRPAIAPTPTIGVNGQNALPARLSIGFIGAGGGANARHQIGNVIVTTAPLPAAPTTSESFTGSATTANAWSYGDHACLTAGTSATPTTSIPACGSAAPVDAAGNGALQLTARANNTDGFAFNRTPFATNAGLSISFDAVSYSTSSSPGDGIALVLTDAARPLPAKIGGCCGSLGYAPYNGNPPLSGGYLGVGLDETGYYSAANEGKTGGNSTLVPNSITARGAAALSAPYLVGTRNAAGTPAGLPFAFSVAGSTRPTPNSVVISLTAAGVLTVTVDHHDGAGPVQYLGPTSLVGLHGQTSLPTSVYVGFVAAQGGANARHQIRNVAIAAAPVSTPVVTITKVNVLTYHNDNNRTGWNPNETALTAANVNPSTFGFLRSTALDGRVDAQPLVVKGQPIDGAGTRDVVYVATENDTLYAIDAESGAILAARNLGTSIPNSAKDYDDNIYPTYGIASTPVIDRTANAIYVVTDTNEGTTAPDIYRLHKLGLNNLSDLVASAVIAPGTTLSSGAPYAFASQHERQRPGLLESKGAIYVAFGSTGDTQPTISRGVIAGFSAATLAPLTSNTYTDRLALTTNPYYLSSIWQSGYAPAADANGNVYLSTSNSSPNAPSYGPPYNYPDSVVRLSGDLSTVLDSFTQASYFSQDQGDGDFGAGGTMLVPDQPGPYPHLVVAGGKDGTQYVLNRDALGGYTSGGPNKDLAELNNGGCWCGPAYFTGPDGLGRIVSGGGNGVATWRLTDTGTSFAIANEGRVSAANTDGQPDGGGTLPVVSSNGTVAGSAVLWFVQKPNDTTSYTLTLRAYSALNLSTQLFAASAGTWTNQNSNANVTPTVAGGYVYVASNKQLQIFGLLGH